MNRILKFIQNQLTHSFISERGIKYLTTKNSSMKKPNEILEGYLQGQNPETITDGQWHHIKLAMEEYASQFQHPVPDEAGEVYVWVKASERHPDNWFTAKLRNIETGEEIGPYPVKSVHKTMIEFDTPGYSASTYINNIEWLSPSPPSGEDAGKGIGDLKQDLFDFFLWFRENGDLYIDKSIENMISIYIKTTHIKTITTPKP